MGDDDGGVCIVLSVCGGVDWSELYSVVFGMNERRRSRRFGNYRFDVRNCG